MGEETNKKSIIKALRKNRRELTTIIDGFKALDETDDERLNRVLAQGIVLTLFEFIDTLVINEIDIHNFIKRRG